MLSGKMLTTYLKYTFKIVEGTDTEKVILDAHLKLRKIQMSYIFIRM